MNAIDLLAQFAVEEALEALYRERIGDPTGLTLEEICEALKAITPKAAHEVRSE
jgi:hypothetical protein